MGSDVEIRQWRGLHPTASAVSQKRPAPPANPPGKAKAASEKPPDQATDPNQPHSQKPGPVPHK